MAILRKTWAKVFLFALVLAALYFGMRLTNLTQLPIFTDEAIYIRWSQIGSRDANWRFISLVDGKQPLFTWLMMVDLRFIRDPLLAGRLVSVGAGLLTMVAIALLSYELFKSKRITLISTLLYLLSPFSLMYDRLALYDSLVSALAVLNIWLAILLVRRLRLDIALLFGMTLGLGMLNKTSGFLSLYLVPLTLILFDWRTLRLRSGPAALRPRSGQAGKFGKRLLKWILLVGLAALISQAMYSILRLSPLFHMISEKDGVFVYTFREWLTHPFNFVEGNLRGEFDWLWRYLSLPVAAAAFWQLVSAKPKLLEKIELFAWWIAPFLALALFGRVLYPRFILFMAMPLLILAAVTADEIISRLGKQVIGLILLALIFVPSIYADYFIIASPVYAPIPFADKGQLINDWPSGWGVAEVNAYLAEKAKVGKVSVYTDGTFGLLPYAIEIYLVDNPNVKIKGIYPIPKTIPDEMIKDAKSHPTYFVLNQAQAAPLGWPLKLIAEYDKGDNKNSKLRFYQVIAPNKP